MAPVSPALTRGVQAVSDADLLRMPGHDTRFAGAVTTDPDAPSSAHLVAAGSRRRQQTSGTQPAHAHSTIMPCIFSGDYHDQVWGTPVTDASEIFAQLSLASQQAGVSWRIVWNKRAHYAAAFQ